MFRQNPPLIMVEGNVGAGKTTFLKILQQQLPVDIIFEPTNKWQHADDNSNLLHLFYKDTARWAYTFQTFAFISRVNAIIDHQVKNQSSKIQFLERSVYCDRYCFAKNCYESGFMTNIEWAIYKNWFSWLAENYTPRPSGFVYLRTTPETCYSRVKKRKRSEETSITIDYLLSLHNRHEEWLVQQKNLSSSLKAIPILILNCDGEFETNIAAQKKHLITIQQFIDQKIFLSNQQIKNHTASTRQNVNF